MKLLNESHNPSNTPEPFKTLLSQLERIKNQQLKQLSNVEHHDDRHVFGYDLCEMLLNRYLENRLGFEMAPTPDFSKYLQKSISDLYNNFERIKTISFLDSLKNDYIAKNGDYDDRWDSFLKNLKHIDTLSESKKVVIDRDSMRFRNILNGLLGIVS